MPQPCEQEQNIKDMYKSVQSSQQDIGLISNNINRLCESNERLAGEMREMNQTLVSHMISNREYSVRIEAMEKAIVKLESTTTVLDIWQNKMKGALVVFPAVCTGLSAVAAGVAIYVAIRGA